MLRTFLVEDSQAMRVALKDLLETLVGFHVVAAHGYEAAATQWLYENPEGWDLAIVDLILAEGSGFRVIRRCREVNPSGRIVVFSAFATDVLRERCLALGADAVISKTSTKELVTYLDSLQ